MIIVLFFVALIYFGLKVEREDRESQERDPEWQRYNDPRWDRDGY